MIQKSHEFLEQLLQKFRLNCTLQGFIQKFEGNHTQIL